MLFNLKVKLCDSFKITDKRKKFDLQRKWLSALQNLFSKRYKAPVMKKSVEKKTIVITYMIQWVLKQKYVKKCFFFYRKFTLFHLIWKDRKNH